MKEQQPLFVSREKVGKSNKNSNMHTHTTWTPGLDRCRADSFDYNVIHKWFDVGSSLSVANFSFIFTQLFN